MRRLLYGFLPRLPMASAAPSAFYHGLERIVERPVPLRHPRITWEFRVGKKIAGRSSEWRTGSGSASPPGMVQDQLIAPSGRILFDDRGAR